MSVEALLAALAREADDDAARVVADARDEADRLVADAQAAAARARDDVLAARRAELRATDAEALARARADARRLALEARARCLARIDDAARAQLPGVLDAPDADAALAALVSGALDALPEGPVAVHCPPALVERVRRLPLVTARGGVRVEGDASRSPGLVATSGDGRVRVEQRLDARLARLRASLAVELARAVAGAEAPP